MYPPYRRVVMIKRAIFLPFYTPFKQMIPEGVLISNVSLNGRRERELLQCISTFPPMDLETEALGSWVSGTNGDLSVYTSVMARQEQRYLIAKLVLDIQDIALKTDVPETITAKWGTTGSHKAALDLKASVESLGTCTLWTGTPICA